MRWILLSLFLLAPVARAEEAAQPDLGDWEILHFGKDGAEWLRADGSRSTPEPRLKWARGILSPDGKYWLQPSHRGVVVTGADGRRCALAGNEGFSSAWTSWGHDSKTIVFVTPSPNRRRFLEPAIGTLAPGPDGRPGRLTVRRLRTHDRGAKLLRPHLSPDGKTLAYEARPYGQKPEKAPPGSVILMDVESGKHRILAADLRILALAWSPDSKTLALSTVAGIALYDVATRKLKRAFAPREMDKRMYAHGAYNLRWHPSGKLLACGIRFLGGRAMVVGGGEPTPLYGDRQIFFLSTSGVTRTLDLPWTPRSGPLRWRRAPKKAAKPGD